MHKRAFAQALKVSDPRLEQKICKDSTKSVTNKFTGSGQCRNKSSSGTGAFSVAFDGLSAVAAWPNGKGAESSEKYSNVNHVTEDIMALSKDEKAVVAGYLFAIREDAEYNVCANVGSMSSHISCTTTSLLGNDV